MNIFCFWGGGHHNIGLYLGAISMHLGSFLRSMYRMGNIFLSLKFRIFLGGGGWGVLEIPDFFFFFWGGGVNGRCWARAYIWRKHESNPFHLGLSHDNH